MLCWLPWNVIDMIKRQSLQTDSLASMRGTVFFRLCNVVLACMLHKSVLRADSGRANPMEAAALKGSSLGAHRVPLLPQLGHFHPAHMDAHVL